MSKTKIIRFCGTKVKRLEAVDISFAEDGATIIGGSNGQGKTSVLDMIMSAVKGRKYMPSQPIKDGAEEGMVKIELNNGVVIRRNFKDGKSSLKVDGASGSPQTFLNELFGEHALDVREFMNADNKRKAAILMKLCGLDFTQIDAEHDRLYADRADANREEARLRSLVASLPRYPDAPDEEVNTVGLMKISREIEAEKSLLLKVFDDFTLKHSQSVAQLQSVTNERDELEARLKELNEVVIPEHEAEVANKKSLMEEAEHSFLSGCFEDRIEEIDRQIAGAEETNQKVRAQKEYTRAYQQQEEAICKAATLDEEVKINRDTKKRMLEEASMPIAGLSVEDGELVYKGRKWDSLSTAEQFMVGTAIQAAIKPDAPIVLLDHMEAFDEDSLCKFAQWCERKGFQVIGTRVSTGDECSYIIEDGSVKEKE